MIIHDWTKLLPNEWFARVNYHSGDKSNVFIKTAYDRARDFHRRWNPHHLDYWLDQEGNPKRIPSKYIREMVADWIAAGRVAGETDWKEWYDKYKFNLKLERLTRVELEIIIAWYKYYYPEG